MQFATNKHSVLKCNDLSYAGSMKNNQHYSQLNQGKRDRLQLLLEEGESQTNIGRVLGVDKSTISREIKRNRKKHRGQRGSGSGPYLATLAERKAITRRQNAKWQGMKVESNPALKAYVVEKLKLHWSPDEISGRMRKDRLPCYVSKTALYEWLRSVYGQPYCSYLYSQRYRVKKRNKDKQPKTIIPNRIGIEQRPLGATNRTRYGHFEGDSVVSGKKTGSKTAIAVLYERKARHISAKKTPNLKPDSFNQAVRQLKEQLAKVKSLTLDNGIENGRYEALEIDTYFCDPYSSWQKGGVENANKMIRQFIPKGTDLSLYSDDYVTMVVDTLNNKPRKSLGYTTPQEIMEANNLLKPL